MELVDKLEMLKEKENVYIDEIIDLLDEATRVLINQKETIEKMQQDMEDNFKRIDISEQADISNEYFI